MTIIVRGCKIPVEIIESGIDRFGHEYEIATSAGCMFLHIINPSPEDKEWNYIPSVTKLIDWKNRYT